MASPSGLKTAIATWSPATNRAAELAPAARHRCLATQPDEPRPGGVSPVQESLYNAEALSCYGPAEGIRLVVLFGSWANGRGHAQSDVDLAVQMNLGTSPDVLQLIFDLQGIFFERQIDLVILTPWTSPLLLHEIFFKGRPLYEANAGVFRSERLRAWKLYQDTAPLRRLQERSLNARVKRLRDVS